MRRRRFDPVERPALPSELVGVGLVEDWVRPGEAQVGVLPVDEKRRALLGDSPITHAARMLAERRLSDAHLAWQLEHASSEPPDLAAVVRRRPTPGQVTTVGLEILETRRWALSPARCDFLDRTAYDRQVAR